MMKALFFTLAILSFSQAQALSDIEFGVALGARSGQAETDIAGAQVNSRSGLQFGVEAIFPIVKAFEVRSGFFYTQRFSEIQNTRAGTVSVDYTYFDVPLTGMLRLGDSVGIFAGPVIAFNQSKDVTCTNRANCAALDARSVIVPLQVGVSFQFLRQVGAELFFEDAPGELSTNVSDMKTVGGYFIYYFE